MRVKEAVFLILLETVLGCSDPLEELYPDTISNETLPVSCKITISNYEIEIKPWLSHEEDVCYFFLPSSVELDKTFIYPKVKGLLINGKYCYESINFHSLGIKSIDKDGVTISISSDVNDLNIKFLKSRNLPALFIETKSGSLDYVHQNKNNIDSVNVILVEQNGHVDYESFDLQGTLKGRGHGTWGAAKKPYLLKLSKKESILGMRKSKKWVLLANAYDETNLRNWLALTMAQDMGLKSTPQCRFVDVYANSDYIGLYLITEKVSENLLSKEDLEPVLLKIDDSSDGESVFFTERGTQLEIENLGDGDYSVSTVKDVINDFEDLLFSGNWEQSVDIETWVKKYLVDEITQNGDAGARSDYFYYFPGERYLYGGPVWDYDLSLGRNKYICGNPYTFTACREWRTPVGWTPHYSKLLKNDIFSNRVKSCYRDIALPIIQSLIDGGVMAEYNQLEFAINMNAIRWDSFFELVRNNHKPNVLSAEDLVSYLKNRVSFLNSAYIEGTRYHLVQLSYLNNMKGQYMCYSVEDGLPFNHSNNINDPEFTGFRWIEKNSGALFDPSMPVVADVQYILDN